MFFTETKPMKYLSTIAILGMMSSFTLAGDLTVHTFKVKSIEGGTIDFSKFKGKKILVVNTASKSGYTPQYEQLEKVYEEYKAKLVVVGFPANNFAQEPGSDREIEQFCKARFGVKFPLASKISVRGDDTAPIYKWLTSKTENGVLDATITWNFTKFLLDENGKMIAFFGSKTSPDSEEILKYLR
jgi:glutathione peroxidase